MVVVDGAAAHRAKSLRVPERLTLVPLPAYTPELNPAERLWPLVKEGVAHRAQKTLALLEEAVCGRGQGITAAQVTALTNYHWWYMGKQRPPRPRPFSRGGLARGGTYRVAACLPCYKSAAQPFFTLLFFAAWFFISCSRSAINSASAASAARNSVRTSRRRSIFARL